MGWESHGNVILGLAKMMGGRHEECSTDQPYILNKPSLKHESKGNCLDGFMSRGLHVMPRACPC